ncbi:hypothetical protein NXC24_PB00404 (plasmid) [Rhizobium sp. NXC24]|nr:hypothetical protein NXC24_PB00404 [Rhizobium sp. NXC24]
MCILLAVVNGRKYGMFRRVAGEQITQWPKRSQVPRRLRRRGPSLSRKQDPAAGNVAYGSRQIGRLIKKDSDRASQVVRCIQSSNATCSMMHGLVGMVFSHSPFPAQPMAAIKAFSTKKPPATCVSAGGGNMAECANE